MRFIPSINQTYWCRIGNEAYSFRWKGDHADRDNLAANNVHRTKRDVLSRIYPEPQQEETSS